jgi:hypothetical protein
VDLQSAHRRHKLAQLLLQLKPGEALSETQRKLSLASAELTLRDMIGHFQKAHREAGAGVAVVRPDGSLLWSTEADVRSQLKLAEDAFDLAMSGTFRDLLELIATIDPEQHILLALATSGGLRIFKLPVEDPAREIRQLLEGWGR